MGRSSARCLPISRPAGGGDSAGRPRACAVRGSPARGGRTQLRAVCASSWCREALLSFRGRRGAAPSACALVPLRPLLGGPGLALLPLLRGRGRTVACHFPPGTLQRLFRTDRHAGRPFAGGRRAQRGELLPGNPQRPALLHGGRLRSGEGLDCEAAMSSCFRLAGNFLVFYLICFYRSFTLNLQASLRPPVGSQAALPGGTVFTGAWEA